MSFAVAASVVVIGAAAAGCSSSSSSSTPAATSSAPGTASSGTSAGPTPAGTGTLTGAAATALAARAVANTRGASSVQVAGKGISSSGTAGETISFNLLIVRNEGCSGTISASPAQTFKLVQTGGYVWLMPSAAFYESLHLSKQAMALVAGKYIKVKTTDKQVRSLTTVCTFNGLFSSLPVPAGTGYTASPVTYQGEPAYQITKAGKPGTATVSNTTTPLLLKITGEPHANGSVTFGDYNKATTITAPSAAESIDGSQLGI